MGDAGPLEESKTLRVAIIGGGPAGLGAAIALSKLPDVEVSLFERAEELREFGAGIRIGYNCWRVLELLEAADRVKGHHKTAIVHRNGLTGEQVGGTSAANLPIQYQPRRVRRTRLQSALISKVPPGVIQLNKKLASLDDLGAEGVRLTFQDGTNATADLVVGADGIRSVVRDHIFPDHKINFTGTTIWRVLIPVTSVEHIPELTVSTSWWHGPTGHIYHSFVDDPGEVPYEERMMEIAARNVVDPETVTAKTFSWGVPATKERVESHFLNYDPRVRELLSKPQEGQWKEFSAFAGPRLEKLTAWNKSVLLGDASHPLSGAFGSGAAFALEDGWILARAIEYARSTSAPLEKALEVFDQIRSPYYLRMYQHLDDQKARVVEAKKSNPNATFESSLAARMQAFGGEDALPWIYRNDIEDVWKTYLREQSVPNGVH
ncbi:salicylate hydroxylase [Exophiala viscosa]|uniref:Salicylate hydroxylase n=1 Tax=Exophiala viscosa TaxID=2486360 RepID=A0AAN6DU33_9EURO|nr:salicylate hydroxylase [Exophiala viscosa]KAI1623768.1 salicylate hydroxylase [Exophiala viscosa]